MFKNFDKHRKATAASSRTNTTGHDRFSQERHGTSRNANKAQQRRLANGANGGAVSGGIVARRVKSEMFEAATLENARRQATAAAGAGGVVPPSIRCQSVEMMSMMMVDNGGRKGNNNNVTRLEALKGLFSKRASSNTPRHDYSALHLEQATSDKDRYRYEERLREKDEISLSCRHYLAGNDRYELKAHLDRVGAREDKHWFIVQDRSLDTDRLLTVTTLSTSISALSSDPAHRTLLLHVFRSLQHPYILPVLGLEFWDGAAALFQPLSAEGSLRDMVYGGITSPTGREGDVDVSGGRATGRRGGRVGGRVGQALPIRQVQCIGRQILEALLFLQRHNFPPFQHLHSGNVIVQNGAARLAGLENTLLDLPPSSGAPGSPRHEGALAAFGYLLFEISTGYELPVHPTSAQLYADLDHPQLCDVLVSIFSNPSPTRPSIAISTSSDSGDSTASTNTLNSSTTATVGSTPAASAVAGSGGGGLSGGVGAAAVVTANVSSVTGTSSVTLEQLLLSDFFRGVELRELRGAERRIIEPNQIFSALFHNLTESIVNRHRRYLLKQQQRSMMTMMAMNENTLGATSSITEGAEGPLRGGNGNKDGSWRGGDVKNNERLDSCDLEELLEVQQLRNEDNDIITVRMEAIR